MTLVKSDIPNLLTVGLQRDFQKSQQDAQVDAVYKTACTIVNSTKSSEKYGWLGAVPKMKKWVDERQAEGLLEHSLEIVNESYEATISVDRDALEDEQYGQIRLRVASLAEEGERFYDEKLAELIEANGTAYDGQNFFDTDHSSGSSGTYSNAPSAASGYVTLTAANFATVGQLAITAMRRFKNDKGKPFGSNPSHVLVCPEDEFAALQAFDPSHINQMQTGASVQSMKGRFKVLVSDYLTAAGSIGKNKVYWLDLRHQIKPFILQIRKKLAFTALDKDDDYANFMRKEVYYGVDNRFGMGYGEHRYAYRTQGA